MKKMSTIAKLASVDLDVIRINGFTSEYGWVTFNDCDFEDRELSQIVEVSTYTTTTEESCGSYIMYGFRFEFNGESFGNSFQSESDLNNFLKLI